MAIRSRAGVGGAIYALVVFVFLFIISLVLAIVFYAQSTKHQEAAVKAQQQLAVYVSNREQQETLDLQKAARDKDRSVVGYLRLSLNDLVRTITGSGDTTLAQTQKALTEAGVTEGRTVLAVLNGLKDQAQAKTAQVASLQKELAETKVRLTQTAAQLDNVRKNYDQTVASLKQQVASLQQDVDAYKSHVDAQRQQLVSGYDKSLTQAKAQMSELQSTINQKNTQITKLQGRIEDLLRQLGGYRPKAPSGLEQTDGKIISVLPEQNLVYINLGQKDKLVLGMHFEVFDAARGVHVEGPDGQTLRGKATIEVIDVGPSSATCRILRQQAGNPTLANDLIANLIYDKNRVYKFYVYGDFDLDQNGQPSIADRDQVVQLVEKWGGKVANHLALDTDFLVIGMEPEMPKPLAPDVIDPTIVREHVRQKERFEEYHRLVKEAESLSIPVLNQNRFMALVGYTAR